MGKWDLLPQKEDIDGKENNYAGDFRAPEMPGLQSMHILFVREHNRLADLVKKTLQNSGQGEFESKFLWQTIISASLCLLHKSH